MASSIIATDVTSTIRAEDFVTEFDVPGDTYDVEQYNKGLQLTRDYNEIHISIYNVWSASAAKDGSDRACFSYETLGLHRSTAALVQGWLDGGIKIIRHTLVD